MNLYMLGGLVVVSVVLVIYALWPTKNVDDDAIKRRMAGSTAKQDLARPRARQSTSVTKKMIQKVTPLAVRPVMMNNAEDMSRLRLKLSTAGLRSEGAPATFLASKTIVAICLGLAGAAYAWSKGDTLTNGMGFTLVGAALGFLAPNMWLSMAISKRAEKISEGLPDTLDMLVISVEAGLALDAAFQRVGDEMHGVHPLLAEELQIVTLETQMGIPRSEALGNFAARTGLDQARSLVAIINQAERFGTSIARALRNQSESLRTKRRQAAEERAQKTTVKLMVPLILFIFPAILVVLAGPAALRMIEALDGTGLG